MESAAAVREEQLLRHVLAYSHAESRTDLSDSSSAEAQLLYDRLRSLALQETSPAVAAYLSEMQQGVTSASVRTAALRTLVYRAGLAEVTAGYAERNAAWLLVAAHVAATNADAMEASAGVHSRRALEDRTAWAALNPLAGMAAAAAAMGGSSAATVDPGIL